MAVLVGLLILQIILTCHRAVILQWSHYHFCHKGKKLGERGLEKEEEERSGRGREDGSRGSEGRKADRCWNCVSASLAGR